MSDDRIRVLHLLGTARAGGVETFVLEFARHIDRSRFHLSVCIMGEDGPVAEDLRAAGTAVHVLGPWDRFRRSALRYYGYLSRGRFDIVHANVGGRLPRYLAYLAGCRIVIAHIHGPPDEFVEGWRKGDRKLGPRIERSYLRGAHSVVASSRSISRMLENCCPSLSGRLRVIPYGVDLRRFKPETRDSPKLAVLRCGLGVLQDDPVVGFVGRLARQKGLSYFLDAAAMLLPHHSNLHFMIVGDGPLRAELESAAAQLAVDRIHFLGERSDIPDLMAAFDVLAVTSEWEPFGLVILEAMAAAKPVVAFDIDGVPESVVHGETGLLLRHRDSRALAFAISQLLEDAPLRERMGTAGRRRVEQHFDVRVRAREWEAFYEEAISRRTKP